MQNSMRLPAVSTACLFLGSLAFAQNTVWVVDEGGHGADFTDIPAAVAAAADGDTILVLEGEYSGFTVDGKGLVVLGDGGGSRPLINGGIVIQSTSAPQRFVLRGFETGVAAGDGLQVQDCMGSVWVEACQLAGQNGFNAPNPDDTHANGFHAMRVQNSANVAVARSNLIGGRGANMSDWYQLMGAGGCGLLASGSNVAVHDSVSSGGGGGSDSGELTMSGQLGGCGVQVLSGSVFSAGSVFDGGQGGAGGSNWMWGGCANGGPGGAGVTLAGGAFTHRDSAMSGGAGGGGAAYYGCQNGPDGPDLHNAGGDEAAYSAGAKSFVAPAPIRAGQTSELVFTAAPGDLALLLFSPNAAQVPVTFHQGLLLIGLPVAIETVGLVGADGKATIEVGFSTLPPGIDSLLFHAQAVFVGADGLTLDGNSAVVLLAPGL